MGKSTPAETSKQIQELTKLWLEAFQLAVNQEDYTLGKRLFSPTVYSFGTIAFLANDLEELVTNQWEKRWPQNATFSFDIDTGKMIVTPPHVICALTWVAKSHDGTIRNGRATVVLQGQRIDDGPVELRCCHSHFSGNPKP